ncbi:lipopolysaccharide biosynthesis protein [Dehalobacterium formicoaceticum]|uniref:Lipopolysaccharide biosynthesis protein n=1 Tax=Dehalobacterium formicoaceticum TaxID=51515 RepID=A0ABT1Y2Z0_9FIRM|nr:lipopolysaccharide biosynthesis protein [Dehalobacterium formicoaceticum]MCR6545241.1 lipopolysaccharide biosynthesis protein [Dehalobacterium formicoaceticum]
MTKSIKELDKREFKNAVLGSLFWRFLERGGTQGIHFIISIIIARLLMPRDFGIIALITVFIAVADTFVQGGFSSALIQKEEVDETDYSSVFFINLIIAGFLYVIFLGTAPLIADFYQEPIITPVFRWLSLIVIFGALNNIQYVVLAREMKFKKSFLVSIGGILASGTVGITMAYQGYGIWSLVFSQIAGQMVSTVILWLSVCWRPQLLFSFFRLKILFSFGSKLLFSGLLDTIFNNIYPLVIGKLYGKTMLGFYNRGQSIPAMLVNNINGTITGVMFPALSHHQNDPLRVKAMMRRTMLSSAFIVFPMMFGLGIVAKPMILLLFTEKWLPCVPFLQLLCISFAFYPVHTANLEALKAVGRSDIFLKLEVIKKGLFILIIVGTIPFGIYIMVAGQAVGSIIGTIINAWPNKQLFHYSFQEQIRDLMPALLLSIAMSGVVFLISLFPIHLYLSLFLQICIGAAFYFIAASLFRLESLTYILATIKDLRKKS